MAGCGQARSAHPGAAIHCPTGFLCAYYDPSARYRQPTPSPGWRQVASPGLPADALFYAITATGAADAWAVGTTGARSTERQPLIIHWDGLVWGRVALPASTLRLSAFQSVAAAGRGDVWVTGVGADEWLTPHVYHFDGARWAEVGLPAYVDAVEGISMTPAGHLWAVCATRVYPGDCVIRWNGRSWTRFPAPPVLTGGPADIAALADNDIWVTGTPSQIYHWDGARWTRTASPAVSHGGAVPQIAALASDDVWAAGAVGTSFSSPPLLPVLLHWDGHGWQKVPVPRAGSFPLAGIAPDGAGGIWVAPWHSDWLGARYLHWRAGRWTDVYANPPGPLSAEFAVAIAPVPGTEQVWSADDGPDGMTLNLYTPR